MAEPRRQRDWAPAARRAVFCLAAAALGSGVAVAQPQPLIRPLTGAGAAPGELPPAPWAVALLPGQTIPATQFGLAQMDGRTVLRIAAAGSYGNLVHPLPGLPGQGQLSWRWRVDALNTAADLRRREGDDSSLKLCVLFDLPLAQVPFVERQLLRVARSRSATPLPAATVCYVWDAQLPEGTRLDNAYSRRVRYLILRSRPASAGQWFAERRDVAADFRLLFGDESPHQVPPLLAIAVGADGDNTGGRSLAHLADLTLTP